MNTEARRLGIALLIAIAIGLFLAVILFPWQPVTGWLTGSPRRQTFALVCLVLGAAMLEVLRRSRQEIRTLRAKIDVMGKRTPDGVPDTTTDGSKLEELSDKVDGVIEKLRDAITREQARNEALGRIEQSLKALVDRVAGVSEEVRKIRQQPEKGAQRESRGDRREEMAPVVLPISAPPAEEAIRERLIQIAMECLRAPITTVTITNRLDRSWSAQPFGSDFDLPDAFIITVPECGDGWLIPNTRRWSKFRDGSFFELAAGPNVPDARISRVRRVPRVRAKGGGGYEATPDGRGSLETTVD